MIRQFIDRLKKKHIPNSYYAVMLAAVFALIALWYLIGITTAPRPLPAEEATSRMQPPVSDLSRRAREDIQIGMDRPEVIRRMGLPNWAVLNTDGGPLNLPPDRNIGLQLQWYNAPCRDVIVTFSQEPYRVIGWDDGTSYCKVTEVPTDREIYDCTLESRQPYCR